MKHDGSTDGTPVVLMATLAKAQTKPNAHDQWWFVQVLETDVEGNNITVKLTNNGNGKWPTGLRQPYDIATKWTHTLFRCDILECVGLCMSSTGNCKRDDEDMKRGYEPSKVDYLRVGSWYGLGVWSRQVKNGSATCFFWTIPFKWYHWHGLNCPLPVLTSQWLMHMVLTALDHSSSSLPVLSALADGLTSNAMGVAHSAISWTFSTQTRTAVI
ncbi:uncharacterized protein EDB93DRAFT_1105960 [Suillus bovinus]|uniref:uncharacterized protein n=1 Tax=Suillus bovinus TaxID=48563 RepID=UPI001B86346B|nr:uncharacterized protein EDB93DRAFT_1105960 [Suillus bovinus]KAG2140222.1 hypothetical protein EDB93DRAFT_1105960 [Suillus bovinus]